MSRQMGRKVDGWVDGWVGEYTRRHMKQQKKDRERKDWGGKEGEGAGKTGIDKGQCPINPMLMTQPSPAVTRHWRSDSLETQTKIGIWVHAIYRVNILRHMY